MQNAFYLHADTTITSRIRKRNLHFKCFPVQMIQIHSKAGSQFKFELQRPSIDKNTWKSEPTLVNSTGEKHWPGYQHEVYKQSCVTEGFGGTL